LEIYEKNGKIQFLPFFYDFYDRHSSRLYFTFFYRNDIPRRRFSPLCYSPKRLRDISGETFSFSSRLLAHPASDFIARRLLSKDRIRSAESFRVRRFSSFSANNFLLYFLPRRLYRAIAA
jgi:hypothetical protein